MAARRGGDDSFFTLLFGFLIIPIGLLQIFYGLTTLVELLGIVADSSTVTGISDGPISPEDRFDAWLIVFQTCLLGGWMVWLGVVGWAERLGWTAVSASDDTEDDGDDDDDDGDCGGFSFDFGDD